MMDSLATLLRDQRDSTMPLGFVCGGCGTTHYYGAWVAAHFDEELTHICPVKDCGRKHVIFQGKALACLPGNGHHGPHTPIKEAKAVYAKEQR